MRYIFEGTMDCNELKELIPEYAIGALGEDEQAAVESLLGECLEARSLLNEYRELTDALLYAIPIVPPPPSLREAMLERAGGRREQVGPFRRIGSALSPGLAWGIAAVAIVVLILTNLYWASALHETRKKVDYQATVVSLIASNHVVELSGKASGMIHYDPNGKVGLLEVFGMPAPPKGKAYQLWLIRPDQKRDSGAVFKVEGDGNGVVIFQAPRPLSEYVGVGVTMEPDGGSPAPTGPKMLGGDISS
jgi:anti-sigma-K factor RskA